MEIAWPVRDKDNSNQESKEYPENSHYYMKSQETKAKL